MTAENLLHFLKNPAHLYDITYLELKALVVQYPYCQNLRYLLARKSKMENLPDSKRDLEIASTYSIDRPLLRRQIEFNASKTDIVIDENIVVNEDVLELQELDSIQSNLTEASLLSIAVEKETLDFSVPNELDGSLSDSFFQKEAPIEINEVEESTTNIIDKIMEDDETLISDEDLHIPPSSSNLSPSGHLIQELNEIEQELDIEEFESAENRSDTDSPHEMREDYQPPSSSVEQEIILEEKEEDFIAVADDLHDESIEAPAERFEDKIETSESFHEAEDIIIEKEAAPIELIIDTPEVEEPIINVPEEASTDILEEAISNDSSESVISEYAEGIDSKITAKPVIEIIEAPTVKEEYREIIEAPEEPVNNGFILKSLNSTPNFNQDIPLEIELTSNDSEGLQPTPKQSFSSWLKQLKAPGNSIKETKEVVVEKTKKESKKESKTKKEAKNTSVKSSKKKDKKSSKKKGKKVKAKEIARQSIIERGDIISETLAALLANQGYKEKAIKMYGKLSHYYPEKSALFAAKINELLESDDE